ncbi:uncharacterized protein PAC_19073 [Phialocephala subalpina]|uniref:Heterokaryon incompatibility domain-containing protein n=1 Tax=Phialocephala subalpina TaxID=576137 RepID=A0A1L7XVW0_9HELO|nr:uncharacterized protein PAC_19073 [Phialocephala subalpina]
MLEVEEEVVNLPAGYYVDGGSGRPRISVVHYRQQEAAKEQRSKECGNCDELEVKNLGKLKWAKEAGEQLNLEGKIIYVKRLKHGILIQASIESRGTSSCGPCKFFASVSSRLEGERDANSELYRYIYAFSARINFINEYYGHFIEQDTVVLGLIYSQYGLATLYRREDEPFRTTGHLCPLQPGRVGPHIEARPISREHFNIAFARSCLDECAMNHKICKKEIASHGLSSTFEIIDCRTDFVVKAPSNCNYVTLSYVWRGIVEEGGSNVSASDQDSIFGRCPKVIMHSVEVSIVLGFEYLWVDRYCINQSNAADKHTQIRQIHLIYSNSQITLIAAARDDRQYGLPSVNGTLRKEQPLFKIDQHTLLSTLPHPSQTLSYSNHFAESLHIPLEAMVGSSTGAFRSGIPPGAFEWKTPSSEPDLFMSYISEFTKREISFQNNRLNAIVGIFHAFERATIPVHQILGIPLCLLMGITWSSTRPGTRIVGFPSWSRAGWTEKVGPKMLRSARLPSRKDVQVWVEMGKEAPVQLPPWKDLPDFSSKLDPNNNIMLHIGTDTFICSTIYFDEHNPIPSVNYSAKPGHYPTIPLEDEDDNFLYLSWFPDAISSHSDRSTRTFTAIVIGDLYSTRRSSDSDHVALLYVEEHEGRYVEKVGCGTGESILLPHHRWTDEFERWMKMNVERRRIKLG